MRAFLATLIFYIASMAHAEVASWYGPGFSGRHTASGERFDSGAMTAAHKALPFGTRVQVCHNDRCVVVRINDRGPYVKGRDIDLSRAAARAIGIDGVGRVTLQVLPACAAIACGGARSHHASAGRRPAYVRHHGDWGFF